MRRVSLAILGVAALSGCGSGQSVLAPSGHSVLHTLRADKTAEISAARRSDASLFRIFPARPGTTACAIPGGAGLVRTMLHGTCRTSIAYPVTHGRYEEAFVRFRESWRTRHSSSWTLIVQWPKLKVVATQLGGETSPQMRYAISD